MSICSCCDDPVKPFNEIPPADVVAQAEKKEMVAQPQPSRPKPVFIPTSSANKAPVILLAENTDGSVIVVTPPPLLRRATDVMIQLPDPRVSVAFQSAINNLPSTERTVSRTPKSEPDQVVVSTPGSG